MLPLHLQPQSHVPLYVQLRDQLRALVHAGDLRPGDRIPASRELATMLGVHRTTVANAYAELESEGLIQGHVGRGTFIKGNGNGLKITPPAPPVLHGNGSLRWELLFADERGEEVLSRLTAGVPEDALSFVMACPAAAFFPIDELQTCVNTVLRREGTEVLNLGPSDGYPPLKAALLELLHHDGIAAKDDNLLITDGCQQSFDLISKAFVRPGDSVIMEKPTYPGADKRFADQIKRLLASIGYEQIIVLGGNSIMMQQSVCAARRFGHHGKPDLSRGGVDLSRGAGALPERADAHACRARSDTGAGPGSVGGHACGEPREAHCLDSRFSESHGHFHAAGFAPKTARAGRTLSGSGGGGPHLRAAACAGGARAVAEAAGPCESGDSHR